MHPLDGADPAPAGAGAAGRRAILSSGLWVAVATLLPFLATAALSVVAGRVLGAELLGQQSLIAFVVALLSALVLQSLSDASIRTLAAARTGQPSTVDSSERWSARAHVLSGVLGGGLVVVVGLLRQEHVAAWVLAGATLAVDAVGWAWSSRIIARDGWSPVARRRLVAQLLAVALGIVAVLAGFGIAGIFLGQLLSSVLLLVLLRPLAPRPDRAARAAVPGSVRRLWLVFAAGAALTQIGSGRIEILFLGVYATGEAIAHYTVAVMLVTAAVTLPTSLATTVMPAVAAASGGPDGDRSSAALVRALRISAVLSLPLAALLVAVAPPFLTALYGPEFTEAGRLSRYMALGAVLIPSGRLATAYWQGLGRLRLPLVAGVVGAVIELGLAFLLIPGLGAPGAVAATLAGQGLTALLLVALTWAGLGRPPVGASRLVLCAAVSAAAGAAGVVAASEGGIVGALLGGLVTTGVFVLLGLLTARLGLGLLGPGDAEWVREALPERLALLVRPLAARPPRQPPRG